MPSTIQADLDRLICVDKRDINSLYEGWWSGTPSGSVRPSDLPGTLFHPPEEWNTLSSNGAGGLAVARDGEVAVVSPGEWLAMDEGRVLVKRRRCWSKDGFLWTASRRCTPLTARRWRVRVYLPRGVAEPIRELESLARALDRAGYWYEGKVRLSGSRHSDQCVLWLAAGDAVNAYEHLAATLQVDLPERVAPPPLTLTLGAFGIAHDPAGGQSLGLAICAAVVAARDQEPTLGPQAKWDLACRAYALCANYPWRHPGSVDPFDVWSRLENLTC